MQLFSAAAVMTMAFSAKSGTSAARFYSLENICNRFTQIPTNAALKDHADGCNFLSVTEASVTARPGCMALLQHGLRRILRLPQQNLLLTALLYDKVVNRK